MSAGHDFHNAYSPTNDSVVVTHIFIYPMDIAVHTHKHRASLSVSPTCFQRYGIQPERSHTKAACVFQCTGRDFRGNIFQQFTHTHTDDQ